MSKTIAERIAAPTITAEEARARMIKADPRAIVTDEVRLCIFNKIGIASGCGSGSVRWSQDDWPITLLRALKVELEADGLGFRAEITDGARPVIEIFWT